MNRDQWEVFHRLNRGWPTVRLIANFESAREMIVASGHGCSGTVLTSGTVVNWCQTTGKGVEGCTSIGGSPVVRLTWAQVRRWVESLPARDHQRARDLTAEWGVICRQRTWPQCGSLGTSWAEKHVYGPLTEVAASELALDRREADLREAERVFVASLAPADEPADLLELLAAR